MLEASDHFSDASCAFAHFHVSGFPRHDARDLTHHVRRPKKGSCLFLMQVGMDLTKESFV
jgi:hypothetical protein